MKRISAVKLFVMILALVMSAPNVYAIKHTKKAKPRKLGIKVFPKGARQQPKARRPITPNQQGITRSPSNPVSKPDLERSVARAETSSKPEASRPLQHTSLATLERRFDYSFKEPITTRKTMTKEAQTEILEQVQQEISIRAQEFVTKQGRWMEGSTRGSKTPFQSEAAWNMYTVKGVTKEEMELANLATKIILYGDEKYPAVTQLIELYESFGHAGKKGLVEAMRNVIEFSKREDDLLRAGIYNPEFRTEGEKLLKEMTDRMPEHVYYGDDLVLKQCYKLIANMQERNSYRYHLNLLEDFIAQEGRLPQTHGWNGKEQTKAQYSAAQQEEYHLYATDKRLMSQYPAGKSAFVDRIRQLWEQYENGTPAQPLSHVSLDFLNQKLPYGISWEKTPSGIPWKKSFSTPEMVKQGDKNAQEQTQHEVLARIQAFVAKQGRWPKTSLLLDDTLDRRQLGVTEREYTQFVQEAISKEEFLLANLATRIMIYGNENDPVVQQLIALYESNTQAEKGLVAMARKVLQHEDYLVEEHSRIFPEKRETPALWNEIYSFKSKYCYSVGKPEIYLDPVYMEFWKLLESINSKGAQGRTLHSLEDFIAKEGRSPQSYGWKGSWERLKQYPQEQQPELLLYRAIRIWMNEFPQNGQSHTVDQTRALWKQYGGQ